MNQTLGLSNAVIQIAAILSYQYLALVWPLYFIMLMLALLIFMQTISAGAVFARITAPPKDKTEDTSGAITLLVAVLYFMSAYHIHLIGFTVFASIAAAHIGIMMCSAFFMWIKK
jgi:hypothetical protein